MSNPLHKSRSPAVSTPWKTALKWLIVVILTGYLSIYYLLPFAFPIPEKLHLPQPLSPTYLASDGSELHQLLNLEGQRISTPVHFDELPETLIHALLAAEDQRFFQHGGFDVLAILRALKNNVLQKRITSGASTLTQQLIKISHVSPFSAKGDRNYFRKIRETFQARHLELIWNKQDILTAYFNRVSYGNLFTGIHAAAQGYLNKPLRDLSPAECAFLAALPHSPTRLNPHRSLQSVTARQQRILHLMHQHGWLDDESLQLALVEKLSLHRHHSAFTAPHLPHLITPIEATATTGQAFSIATTIDSNLQKKTISIINRHLDRLTHKNVTQAAAVIIENATGHVLALVGSRDFFDRRGGQINGAWTPLSPGSALKPFTYLLALEQGETPATIIPDIPVEYPTDTGLYRPENYNRQYHGPVTLRKALGNSLNIPAVRLLQKIGGESVLHQALQNFGLTTLNEKPNHYGLGLTIGNAPVRLLELTNAYATLARQGQHLSWTLTPSASSSSKVPITLASPQSTYLIADILADNQARQLTFGPRSVIRMPFPCAVKTGTSTDYRDNWTLGFTVEFTVGVWAGNFDNSPMNQVSGVTGAGPIFRELFIHLHQTLGTTWFSTPEEIITRLIDPRNGKIVDPTLQPRMTQQEHFRLHSLPPIATATDYEPKTGRAYLSTEYTPWLNATKLWYQDLLAIRPNPALSAPPRILTPVDGSVFILDPDLPDQGRRLLVRANDPSARWDSPTLKFIEQETQTYVLLEPGTHSLTLHQADTGHHHNVQIQVRQPIKDRTLRNPKVDAVPP